MQRQRNHGRQIAEAGKNGVLEQLQLFDPIPGQQYDNTVQRGAGTGREFADLSDGTKAFKSTVTDDFEENGFVNKRRSNYE